MTRDAVIQYWEQFDAEIDDIYDIASEEVRAVLEEQRKMVEFTISALRQQGVPGKDVGNNDPLTLDDAIAHLDDTLSDTGRKWSCESCRMEHVQLRAWLAELRDIKQERNAPLTLDELRQMDGEPVWNGSCTELAPAAGGGHR